MLKGANKVADAVTGNSFKYPDIEPVCDCICCTGVLFPWISICVNWNNYWHAATKRQVPFPENFALPMCLFTCICQCCCGLYGIGPMVCLNRYMMTKHMKYDPYEPCPDMLFSCCCWCCTFSQDAKAVEQFENRGGLVGAALGVANEAAKVL